MKGHKLNKPLADRIRAKKGLTPTAPKESPASAPRPKERPPLKPRLPNKSRFTAWFDGKNWSGELVIVTIAEDVLFSATHTSLTKLCYKLDDLYREWLNANSSSTASKTADNKAAGTARDAEPGPSEETDAAKAKDT